MLYFVSCLPSPQSSSNVIKTKVVTSSSQAESKGHELFSAGMESLMRQDFPNMERNFSAATDSFWLAGSKDSAYLAASKLIAACVYQYRSDRVILVHKRFAANFLPTDTSMAIAKLLNNASAGYSFLFQDPQALDLLEQTRKIHTNRIVAGIDSGIGGKLLSDNYSNQGLILYRTGTELKEVGFAERGILNFKLALAKFDTAQNLYESFNLVQSASQKAAQLNNRGLVMIAIEDYEQARSHFEQSQALELSMPEPNMYLVTNYHYNKALAYLSQNEYDQAISILNETTPIYESALGKGSLQLFEGYGLLAKAYSHSNQFERALENCQKAFSCYSLGNTSFEDFWQNPSIDELLVRIELLEVLTYKLASLESISNLDDPASIEKILPTYELAFNLLDQLKANAYSETSSYFISFYSSEILKGYLGLTERLAKLTPQAYQQVDNNRASYLLQGITLSRLQTINALPDSLKEQEANLNNSINQLSLNRILYSKWGPDYAPLVKEIEVKLSAEKAKKAQFEQHISSSHPAYHSLRYVNTDALKQAEALLQEGQFLLEYFVGLESIYTFRVDKSGLQLFVSELDSVQDWISLMTGSAMYDSMSTAPSMDFLAYANKLYDRLLKPVIADLDTSYHRMIIIPDGPIAALPFGMLVKDDSSTDFRDIPFLIKDFAIGYGYSTSSFAMQKQQYNNQALPDGSLLAVAPSFPASPNTSSIASRRMESDEGLYHLKHNVEEVSNIEVVAKKTLKGSKANPENFLELWNQYQFIHLATHAIPNQAFPDEAAIAFSHEGESTPLLRIKDLPDRPWYAKMLVLSACQTGSGQQVSGEGIISLARGFALKGIQSIVATQWSVKDPPTARLMDKFYQFLKAGMPRDIALQKAQLSLVEGGEDRKAADGHPFYWAAFTLYGDSSPVEFPDKEFPTLPLLAGLLFLGLAWGLWKKTKQ